MLKEHLKEEVVRSKTIVATDYICDICKKRICTDIKGKKPCSALLLNTMILYAAIMTGAMIVSSQEKAVLYVKTA